MMTVLLTLALAAPFPLPAIDGKALAVAPNQKSFRVPMRFEKVKRFYAEHLGETAEVSQVETTVAGKRVVTIATKAKSESWKRAVIREGEVETVIDVTPVMRLEDEQITGNAKPLVEFIFGRSPEVQRAIDGINHTEQMRSK